jgi:1-acyl-sn-glycerol-3-phosphate acyltransferase
MTGLRSLHLYDPKSWKGKRRFLRFLLKTIGFSLLVRLDRVEGLENIPQDGPVIFLINHIAFVDPIAVLYVVERDIVPMAKAEVYDLPFIGIFPKMWGVIPVRRDDIDRGAIRKALEVLKAGECLLVAPEGTRGDALQKGRDGAAYLASRADAAVVPVAIEGTVGFPAMRTSSRWKLPGAHIRFGKAFRFKPEFNHAKGEQLNSMTDEAMYVLSELLPEQRRGEYSELSFATQETIKWL